MRDKMKLVAVWTILTLSNVSGQTWFNKVDSFLKPELQAAAVFDIDNDGDQDIITAGANEYHVSLNISDGSNPVEFSTSSYSIRVPGDDQNEVEVKGLGLHDINRDGKLDLYLCKYGDSLNNMSSLGSVRLNNGDGTFEPVDFGLNSKGMLRTVHFADFDKDGYFDSYHSVPPYWNYSIYGCQMHAGTGIWDSYGPNIIDSILPEINWWSDTLGRGLIGYKSNVIRDFDLDGKPDIITGAYSDLIDDYPGYPNYQGDWLRGIFVFRNISQPGQIRFANVSNNAIDSANSDGTIYSQMHVYSIVPGDFDRDGDLDLFVTGPNDGSAHLAQETNTPIVKLYRNDSYPGFIRFQDITSQSGVSWLNDLPPTTKRFVNLAAGVPVDFNNDGFLDVIHVLRESTSHPITNSYAWRNNGDFTFHLIDVITHGLDEVARDISYGDFNNDGKIDIVTVDGKVGGHQGNDIGSVYINEHPNNGNYVKFRITDSENEFGLGSKVTVLEAQTNNIIGYKELRTDFCYRSKRDAMLHFGLGSIQKVAVQVHTNTGEYFQFYNMEVNVCHNLNLETVNKEEMYPERFDLRIYPNPASDKIHVRFNSDVTGMPIQVYDVYGRLCISNQIISEYSTILDVSGLAPGYYYIHMANNNWKDGEKFLKLVSN